jgi:hypothetical protein
MATLETEIGHVYVSISYAGTEVVGRAPLKRIGKEGEERKKQEEEEERERALPPPQPGIWTPPLILCKKISNSHSFYVFYPY